MIWDTESQPKNLLDPIWRKEKKKKLDQSFKKIAIKY